MSKLIITLGALGLLAALVMVCWNISIAVVFSLPELSFMQAVGLTVLLGLFKSTDVSRSK